MRHILKRSATTVVILILSLWVTIMPAPLSAEETTKSNVAIMNFSPVNASAGEAVVITSFIRGAFIRDGRFAVVEKDSMDKILAEQAFQQTGCTNSECAVKLGKLLNVHKMVVGEYSIIEGLRFITASFIDVETGRMERTGSVQGFDVKDVNSAASQLVAQLMGEPGGQSSASPVVDVRASTQADEARQKADAETVKDTAREEKENIKADRKTTKAMEPVDPRVTRGRIGVGLNYPGLGLRALIYNRWMVEARGQYEKEAQAVGGRLYLYVFPSGPIYPYLGIEVNYAMYDGGGVGMKGNGTMTEPLAGLEYFLWKKLSLQFDFGPAYITLENNRAWVYGIRYAVNFGLTYYF